MIDEDEQGRDEGTWTAASAWPGEFGSARFTRRGGGRCSSQGPRRCWIGRLGKRAASRE